MNKQLKFLRLNHGYSQNEVALKIGVSRQSYIKYEQGETEPGIEVIRKICELYNIDYAYLLDENNQNDFLYKIKSDGADCVNESASYSSQKAVYFNTLELTDFMKEAKLRGLSISDFFIKAAKAFIFNDQKKDTLSEWKPLNLGKMYSCHLHQILQFMQNLNEDELLSLISEAANQIRKINSRS